MGIGNTEMNRKEKSMDTFYWLTAALIVSVSAICGTILLRERMRIKALNAHNVKREKAYREIAAECARWRIAYEQEHGERIACESLIAVQKMIYGKRKVADCGGKIGGKK